MRSRIATILVLSALCRPALAETAAGGDSDWKPWRSLAVQDGGRQKPLDSLAWETWRMIGNRTSLTDPQSGQVLDATAMYLSMLLDWQGWDQQPSPHRLPAPGENPHQMPASMGVCTGMSQAAAHQPDKWDRCPLILVDAIELRQALGMKEGEKYISPLDLSQAMLRDPHSQASTPFLVWTRRLALRQDQALFPFEKKAVELASRLRAYQDHRAGRRLDLLPIPNSEDMQWASLEYVVRAPWDDKTDPQGALRRVKDKFRALRAAYLAKSPQAFRDASAAFLAAVREVGPQLGPYPAQRTIDLEVAYNHAAPFRFAWIFMLIAALCVLVHLGSGWKFLYPASLLAYAAGLAAMLAGFVLRVGISGRAPVTNMYESVIYVGLGVAALGLILELIYRKRFSLAAAAVVATLTLILADNCPVLMDPSLQPLQPVLRNNFWLVTHVMTITLSYAAFALALGIGDITLGYYLFGSKDFSAVESLSRFTYRCLQVGFVLLAVGTVTGAVWADYAWGCFWSWDPKEVWALITLIVYAVVLHARFTGWVANFGLAALSVACFSLVVVAWYGVNFVMGSGLHTYGFSGSGGQTYVAGVIVVQFLYILAAAMRSRQPDAATCAAETRHAPPSVLAQTASDSTAAR